MMQLNFNNILDVNELNFEEEVVLYSMNSIVLLNFWAKWSKPSVEYKKQLGFIVQKYSNKIRLAHVDVDSSPLLTSRFAVYSLPSLKFIFQGNIFGNLVGFQPDFRIIETINTIRFPDPLQLQLEKAEALRNENNFAEAIKIYSAVLDEHPSHPQAMYGLAICQLHFGNPTEAYYLLKDFPASSQYQDAEILLPLANTLMQMENGKLADKTELDIAFLAALRFALKNKIYQALDGLLVILKQDHHFQGGLARKNAVALIELLPDNDPQKRNYRSELNAALF